MAMDRNFEVFGEWTQKLLAEFLVVKQVDEEKLVVYGGYEAKFVYSHNYPCPRVGIAPTKNLPGSSTWFCFFAQQ
jgi:hypothetical protein